MTTSISHPDDADLIALLDRELGDAERAGVEHHIAACAQCEELVSRQERANRALAAVLAADLPAAARGEDAVPVRWRVRAGVGAAGAGVLAGAAGALIVVGLLSRRRRGGPLAA